MDFDVASRARWPAGNDDLARGERRAETLANGGKWLSKFTTRNGCCSRCCRWPRVSGCCLPGIPLPGENQCPTDARRLYCTCGEEAVRRCPCGPDREFYGLKPTCWREWPEGWQCNGCEGLPYVDRDLCGEPVAEAPTSSNRRRTRNADLSNPFRSKSGAAELPLPPQAPQIRADTIRASQAGSRSIDPRATNAHGSARIGKDSDGIYACRRTNERLQQRSRQ